MTIQQRKQIQQAVDCHRWTTYAAEVLEQVAKKMRAAAGRELLKDSVKIYGTPVEVTFKDGHAVDINGVLYEPSVTLGSV